jgi:hypothetical protein
MKTKRILSILATTAAAALVAGAASAATAPSNASLLIRHQVRGCHSWAANGRAFKASQSIVLRKGGWITITNNDMMPHKLVETSGPAVQMQSVKTPMGMGMHGSFGPGMMAHMGATTKVWFTKSGVYRFTTKPGEDYMPGIKTVGEDNVLRLTVKVV